MATFDKNNSNNRFTLRLTVTETGTSTTNNTSTVSYTLQLIANTSYWFSGYAIGYSVTLDGTTVASQAKTGSYNLSGYSTLTLCSGTATINHNSDGTKTMSVGFTITMTVADHTPGSLAGSGSMVLTSIPRASTMTLPAGNFTAGNQVTITITPAASGFTHAITYVFGSAQGTAVASTANTTVYWTPPTSLLDQIPGSSTGVGTLTLNTYSSGSLIGSRAYSFTLQAGSSAKPTCSLSIAEITSYASTYGAYVQGYSRLRLTLTGTPTQGASIQGYWLCVGQDSRTSSTWDTNALPYSGSVTVSGQVRDSRQLTSNLVSQSITFLPYAKPTVTLTAYRCNSSGTADQEGLYMRFVASASISSLNSRNSATYSIRYKRSTSGSWTTTSGSGTSYTSSVLSLAASATCEVEATFTDRLSSTTATTTVQVSYVLMDFHNGGQGIAFGKVSEGPGFECDMASEFLGDVDISGDVAITGGLEIGGKSLVDLIYPVGSIYMSIVSNFDPAYLFGGSWTRLEDRFLLGAGDTYSIGCTGGEAAHLLTVSELPKHRPTFSGDGSVFTQSNDCALNKPGSAYSSYAAVTKGADYTSQGYILFNQIGGDTAHNNMPPYRVVYMWARTA